MVASKEVKKDDILLVMWNIIQPLSLVIMDLLWLKKLGVLCINNNNYLTPPPSDSLSDHNKFNPYKQKLEHERAVYKI